MTTQIELDKKSDDQRSRDAVKLRERKYQENAQKALKDAASAKEAEQTATKNARADRAREETKLAANKKPNPRPATPAKPKGLKPLDPAQDHELIAQNARIKANGQGGSRGTSPPFSLTEKRDTAQKQAQVKAPSLSAGQSKASPEKTEVTPKDQARIQKVLAISQKPLAPAAPTRNSSLQR